MSISPQNLQSNSNSFSYIYFTTNPHVITTLKTPNFSLSSSLSSSRKHFSNLPHFRITSPKLPPRSNLNSLNTLHWSIRALEPDRTVQKSHGVDNIDFDALLSIIEFLCLASSAVISIGFAVNSAIGNNRVFAWLGNRVFVWQFGLLVGAAAIGALIRRRQWRRICSDVSKRGGSSGVDFVGRVEKLEEDLRSSATIIKVLSRQLEKLGIRFRVTRKALKEPIAETAALAQKNSEATRALAVQEDILEKELSEIQKVLLAMQEQQQKQLELILAITKNGKLWDNKRGPSQEKKVIETLNSAEIEKGAKQTGKPQIQDLAIQKEASNDRA